MSDGGMNSDGMTPGEKNFPEGNASKKDTQEEHILRDPVFHYSREHRLSRASSAVQDLYDGKPIRPSLSRTLFATKGNVFIFASIILICAMFGIASRFSGRSAPGVRLGGNSVALTIVREEGVLILSMVKNAPKSGEFYTGEIDIAVSPVMSKSSEGEVPREIPDVFVHRIYFHPVDTESFSVSLPFEENNFIVLIKAGDEQKAVRVSVRRN